MTRHFSRIILLLSLGVLALFSFGQVVAEEPANRRAIEGLLVLRNGNVLAGQIVRLQDHYRVAMPKGQLQVPVEQVEMFCHNLTEAYESRRAMRTGSTADSHLELARWCLRQNLLEYAARELLDARAIDPHYRNLPILERQLQYALQVTEKVVHAPPPSEVVQATAEIELSSLERAPRWARVLFVRQIQPLLMQSCATSECHQQRSVAQFQLNRLATEGVGHPDATLSNLAATLAQIDWCLPDQSALLERAASVHGLTGASQSQSLPTHQLQMLRTWIRQLAAAHRNANLVDSNVEPIGEHEQTSGFEQAPADFSIEQRPSFEMASDTIQDPFDPEEFNSIYGSRSDATAQSSESSQDSTVPPLQAEPAMPD